MSSPPVARLVALRALALGCAALALAPARVAAQVRGGVRVGAELEPARRLRVTLSERALFGARIAESGRYQTQLEVSYGVTSFLRLGVGYRASFEEGYGSVTLRQRPHFDAQLHARWSRLRFGYRLRLQGAFEQRPTRFDADGALRNRVSLFVNPRGPFEFGVEAELRSQLESPALALDRARFEATARVQLRPVELGLTYRYDAPLDGAGQPYHLLLFSTMFQWEAPHSRVASSREGRRRERERAPGGALAAPSPTAPRHEGSPTPQPADTAAPAEPSSPPASQRSDATAPGEAPRPSPADLPDAP